MNSREHNHFRELVTALFTDGELSRNERAKAGGTVKKQSGLGAWQWFSKEHALTTLLKKTKGNFGDHVLYVRPPSGIPTGALVALWASWDFDKTPAECKIEVMMKFAEKQIYGFRVDPPHSGYEKHKYWHVQFMHGFSEAKFWKSTNLVINASTPAFPVLVSENSSVSPKDAAAYAAVSLYGRDLPNSVLVKLRKVACTSLSSMLPSAEVA